MPANEALSWLPVPVKLERNCRAIAALEIALCRDGRSRTFTYDPAWRNAVRLATVNDFGGDSAHVIFDNDAALVRAFNHESEFSPWATADGSLAPGLVDELPDRLSSYIDDPLFRTNGGPRTNLTFCAWHLGNDDGWHSGLDPDDVVRDLLSVPAAPSSRYEEHIAVTLESFVEEEALIEHFISLRPATPAVLAELEVVDIDDALAELKQMGYPTAD